MAVLARAFAPLTPPEVIDDPRRRAPARRPVARPLPVHARALNR
ncbi:hypothetical protein [Brevundimonas denitrificans]|nr:hypothetical protein [Brevundimonas denitrificans]